MVLIISILDLGNNYDFNKGLLQKRKSILLRYIDNEELELHSLYALQQLVHELEHPQGNQYSIANYIF